ncbi:MAG: hypothetical protein KDD38_03980 [Bdellovibrionales bacterium]|nr:hypothetical protein [Bdellovibrionales bacterium]
MKRSKFNLILLGLLTSLAKPSFAQISGGYSGGYPTGYGYHEYPGSGGFGGSSNPSSNDTTTDTNFTYYPSLSQNFQYYSSMVPPSGYEPAKSSTSNMGKKLRSILKKLPNGPIKNGLDKYLNVISPELYKSDGEVGGQNIGIATHLTSSFRKGDCLQSVAKSFYKEVEKLNSTHTKKLYTKKTENSDSDIFNKLGSLDNRSSLADTAGEGENKDLQKGWLWQAAMKHAKNNPNLAISLIAMCGHDDISQGEYIWFDDSKVIWPQLQYQRNKKNNIVRELQNKVANMRSDDPNFHSMAAILQNLTEENTRMKSETGLARNMACPVNDSIMYIPESLGAGADISDELKFKIAKIQSPTKGPQLLPAKYYHVYGSAFMACQLIQGGIKAEQAVILQKQAARYYRGVRMCELARGYESQRAQIMTLYNDYKKDFFKTTRDNGWTNRNSTQTRRKTQIKKRPLTIDEFLFQKMKTIMQSERCIRPKLRYSSYFGQQSESDYEKNQKEVSEYNNWYKINGQFCGELSSIIGLPSELEASDLPMLREKISIALEKMNAADLYQKWYLGGGKILGQDIPCTDIRMFGPKSLTDQTKGKRKPLSGSCLPNFSSAACTNAKQRLATWDVDFEWTIAQHEAGAKFAGENCKPNKENLTLNDMACRAKNAEKISTKNSNSSETK